MTGGDWPARWPLAENAWKTSADRRKTAVLRRVPLHFSSSCATLYKVILCEDEEWGNPLFCLHYEVKRLAAKKKGAKLIAITALEASKHLTPKHSCGKNLYEVCDIVLDNCTPEGDCCIDLEGFDGKVCGMSMFTTSVLVQAATYRAAQILVEKGIVPPMYKSQNIDGGPEFNEALEAKYVDRLNRI